MDTECHKLVPNITFEVHETIVRRIDIKCCLQPQVFVQSSGNRSPFIEFPTL